MKRAKVRENAGTHVEGTGQVDRAGQAELTAKFFRGLSDPTRLRIIEVLLEKELNVSQLVEVLGVPQSKASNHLACLKWCGFVSGRKSGKNVYYRVSDDRVRGLVEVAKRMMTDNARNTLEKTSC